MEEILYFAYGSNINLEQMAHRCPDAQIMGPVTLENYELQFRGSGFAPPLHQRAGICADRGWYSRSRHGLHHGRTNVPPARTAVSKLLPRDPAGL